MDKRLHNLWINRQYPYNQNIIYANKYISLEKLRASLFDIAEYLYNEFSSSSLSLNHDWHQHDGYINESEVHEWTTYMKKFESVKSLYNSSDGDDYVRIVLYPEELTFILRYDVREADDEPVDLM